MNDQQLHQIAALLSAGAIPRAEFEAKCLGKGIDMNARWSDMVDTTVFDALVGNGTLSLIVGGYVGKGKAAYERESVDAFKAECQVKASLVRRMGDGKRSKAEMDALYKDITGREDGGSGMLILKCQREKLLDFTPTFSKKPSDEYWATTEGRNYAAAMLDPV